MPSESTFRRLGSFVSGQELEQKLQRHSRNGLCLARALESFSKELSGVRRVVFPGLESHPQHVLAEREMRGGGSLINLELNLDKLDNYLKELKPTAPDHRLNSARERTESLKDRVVDAFIGLVILLAGEAGLEVNKGTSFGFDTTRLAKYSTENSQCYVRIAVGTETVKDLWLLAGVFKKALVVFSEAIDQGQVLSLGEMLKEGEKPKIKYLRVS